MPFCSRNESIMWSLLNLAVAQNGGFFTIWVFSFLPLGIVEDLVFQLWFSLFLLFLPFSPSCCAGIWPFGFWGLGFRIFLLDFFWFETMEEVERANRSAVESCHRVVNILSQPQDEKQCRNLTEQTGEAVHKFKKVVSLLSSSCGHARARKSKKLQIPFPQNIFLETPLSATDNHQPKPLQLLQINPYPAVEKKNPIQEPLGNQNPSLELSSHGKTLQLAQQTNNYHFLQQHHQQQRFQLQQQQAELMHRRTSNSGISLNFDSSTMSSTTRSFISSLSMDGSVANLDGSSFHLIGAARSADQSSYHNKRRCSGRGEDGSVKCGGNGRCHCSKKRYLFQLLFFFALCQCY